jgi:hypothetical protein
LRALGPSIVFMLKHLDIAGCPFTAKSIQCHPCPPTRSGGFSPEHGILLCQDRFFSKRHMEDTIVHEMIHAFDHCRFDVKWLDLRHHACSEVCLCITKYLVQALISVVLPCRFEPRTCQGTVNGQEKCGVAFTHSRNNIRYARTAPVSSLHPTLTI